MPRPNLKLAQHPKHRGVTMVELLVTIMIVGVLATVAAPAYREFVANTRIKSGAFDLVATLTMARSEAIKRNTTVTVTPTQTFPPPPVGNDWAQGWIVTTVTNVPVPNTPVLVSQQNGMRGLTVTCLTGSPAVAAACGAPVTYGGNGRSNSGIIQSFQISAPTLANGANPFMRCITIDLSGRPNSKKGVC